MMGFSPSVRFRLGTPKGSVHVAYLSGSSQLGGAERVLLAMLTGIRLKRPTWHLTVILPSEGPLWDEAERLGASVLVVVLPTRVAAAGDYALRSRTAIRAIPGVIGYLFRLHRVLRHLAPDILHSNGFKMHLAAAWTKPANSRVIWHLHDYVSRRWRSTELLRWSIHRCLALVANSRSVAADAARALSTAPLPVLNGVDLTVFQPAGEAADLDGIGGATLAPRGTVRVGLVGTYAHWKGHRVFLEAIAALPSVMPIRAYIVGGPVYQTTGSQWTRAALEALTQRLHLRERVVFIDFVHSPAAVFRALDIVVHASTEPEPFGLVVAEAMACGRAVIAALDGGVKEIVTPGVDSMVHNPGDVHGLAEVITALVRDRDLRRRLGEAARRTAEARLGSDRFTDDLCQAYDHVMSRALGTAVPISTQ